MLSGSKLDATEVAFANFKIDQVKEEFEKQERFAKNGIVSETLFINLIQLGEALGYKEQAALYRVAAQKINPQLN